MENMIYISAGHHEVARGACTPDGKLYEYPLTALWADEVIRQWRAQSDRVVPRISRVPDGTLREKVRHINNDSAVLAVEIHFNSDPQRAGRGSETLYYPGSALGRACAQVMQDELARVFTPDRGPKEGWYRMDPKFGPDYFLRKTICTALIVEPAFIHETTACVDDRVPGCAAIVEGIYRCITEVLRGSIADRIRVQRGADDDGDRQE